MRFSSMNMFTEACCDETKFGKNTGSRISLLEATVKHCFYHDGAPIFNSIQFNSIPLLYQRPPACKVGLFWQEQLN